MARVVFGLAVSHGPLLSTPPEKWYLRENADRQNKRHVFRGDVYDFEGLRAARRQDFSAESTLEKRIARHAACQKALDTLATKLHEVAPDLVIIIGNDQREVFKEDYIGAFTVYTGETVENVPHTPEERERIERRAPGVTIAEAGHCPPEGATYLGAPDLARYLVHSFIDQHFDVAQSAWIRGGDDRQHGIPHAYGFVYRRILRDAPPPSVPIFLNVDVPDNRPRILRCLDFGRALARAVGEFDADARVAIIASGGLSHFVVDEELDREVLRALQEQDEPALAALPERYFQGTNTAETKSWLTLAAAMAAVDKRMHVVDYVPCYRTEAGTGQGMGFAFWE